MYYIFVSDQPLIWYYGQRYEYSGVAWFVFSIKICRGAMHTLRHTFSGKEIINKVWRGGNMWRHARGITQMYLWQGRGAPKIMKFVWRNVWLAPDWERMPWCLKCREHINLVTLELRNVRAELFLQIFQNAKMASLVPVFATNRFRYVCATILISWCKYLYLNNYIFISTYLSFSAHSFVILDMFCLISLVLHA